MMNEQYVDFEAEESIDIKAFITKCLHYWYYFAFALVVAFFIAMLFNRFKTSEYRVTTYVLVSDIENPLDPQSFAGASLTGNPYKLQNEIGILQSKSITERTLQDLDFFITYYAEEKFVSTVLYNEAPFFVVPDSSFAQPLGVKFSLIFICDTSMIVEASGNDVTLHKFSLNKDVGLISEFRFADTLSFGDLCGNQYCRFRILPDFNFLNQIGKKKGYSFEFNSLAKLTGAFRLHDVEATKNSSILKLSVRCRNVRQGVAYLNKLTGVYLAKGVERDDRIAVSTIDFIDDQLKEITDSLRYSEDKLQHFRTTRGVTNIDFQAQQTYEQMESHQNRKAELIVKSKYYRYLKEYLLQNNRVDDLIAPSSMDINDPLLNNLIIELTRLYTERTEMSFNTIKDNPYLSSLERKIGDVKAKLVENIDNIIKNSDISLREIDSRIAVIESAINQLPESQRELLVIERKFKLNDAIYTYLLTKRSEVQISKVSNLPSNEVLDPASPTDFEIISPNTRSNYIIALMLGLIIPVILIYLGEFFRNKIVDKKDIQSITNLEVIGQILHSTYKTNMVVNDFPNSLVAESFRTLRTNFQFFNEPTGKIVVLVTSIIKGEGKSFTSVNLGSVFAQGLKKVVIIDFDLRRAKIKQYLDIESHDGISRYLSNNTGLDDIVFSTGISNLDVIPSGPIPPNPLELISSAKTGELFEELKKRYDVILIDSPPIALVSDALLLLKYAGMRLVVVRSNYTPRNLFASVLGDLEKRGISPLNVILNDDRAGSNGYGYGYGYANGYGYGHDTENLTIRQKINRFFRLS